MRPRSLTSLLGTTVTLAAALGVVVSVVVACGDADPAVSGDGPMVTPQPPPGGACATPNTGCPCEKAGAVVPCSVEFAGDSNFIFCQSGTRECLPTSTWGVCDVGGGIQTKALATTPTTCTGGLPRDVLSVCINGKHRGDFCTTDADCANGFKLCTAASENTVACKDDSDCSSTCGSFNGKCAGGSRIGAGCDGDADCPTSTCTVSPGNNTCFTYTGICDSNDATDGEACSSNADCGSGTCTPPKFGVCLGGKKNGKKCKLGKHCKGGGSCSNGNTTDGGTAINPCDPFCNTYNDTYLGFDAGPGFQVADGGLTNFGGCGNSVLNPGEQCDDGNTTSGDGCTAACTLEPGYTCPTPGMPCSNANCGNGILEGLEQCDDANKRPYDGCFNCQKEVDCPSPLAETDPSRPCNATCGDGIKFPTEDCDDGNIINGDGCSSTCTIEPGATCTTSTSTLPPSIDVPVLYRDFRGCRETDTGVDCATAPDVHPDFNSPAPHAAPGYTGTPVTGTCYPGPTPAAGFSNFCNGIARNTLPADREPDYLLSDGTVFNATSFREWYRTGTGPNPQTRVKEIFLTSAGTNRYLRLFKQPGNDYVFDSDTDTVTDNGINCGYGSATTCSSLGGFWPINAEGFGNYNSSQICAGSCSSTKNFHFTSEVRFPFTYAGGEKFSFTGDDDVFVYIGGKKIADLGGIHAKAQTGVITLGTTTATYPNNVARDPGSRTIDLEVGKTYEIAVFQAERNVTGSNYRLTLQGFQRTTSSCTPAAPSSTIIRDFTASCRAGQRIEWQLFRWKAAVPNAGSNITFRAATAADATTFSTNPNATGTVAIGTATSTNSPINVALNWANDTMANPAPPPTTVPAPVSKRLSDAGQKSQANLRVYMTFTGAPILYEWQQLFDCIDEE